MRSLLLQIDLRIVGIRSISDIQLQCFATMEKVRTTCNIAAHNSANQPAAFVNMSTSAFITDTGSACLILDSGICGIFATMADVKRLFVSSEMRWL